MNTGCEAGKHPGRDVSHLQGTMRTHTYYGQFTVASTPAGMFFGGVRKPRGNVHDEHV